MRMVSERVMVVPVLLALAVTAGACTQAEETPSQPTTQAPPAVSSSSTVSETAAPPEERTDGEREFLDELAEFGLPTGMSAETTVEVGIGICESIAGGADTDTILDHIRPLSSAIASQSDDHDTDRVGRAIVEASRTHLCD